MPPQIAILIVSYNVRSSLRRALQSLGNAFSVVVVDNASQDGSAAMVRTAFPHVTLVANSENIGFGAAVNRAAACTDASHYLLLNPDAWLPPGSAQALLQKFTAHQINVGAWAMGLRQVDEAGHLQLSFGLHPTFANEMLRKVVQGQFDSTPAWGAQVARALVDRFTRAPRVVPWVAGSALMVERTAFWRVGGFDPGYFLFFEDIDFCLRLAQAGGTVVYDPTITLGHSRGVSARGAAALSARAYRDSQARFAHVHQGVWTARCIKRWAAFRRIDTLPVP